MTAEGKELGAKPALLAYSLSIFLAIFSFALSYSQHRLIVDNAALIPLMISGSLFILICALDLVFYWRGSSLSLHLSSFIIFNMVVFAIIFYGSPEFFISISALAIFSLYYFETAKHISDTVVRIPAFFATLLVMTFLGGIVAHIAQPAGFPVTVESTGTMFTILGLKIPLLEEFGVFIISPIASFVTSPVEYLLFFSIAALVSENYHEIITYVAGRKVGAGKVGTAVYGLTGALSCQCESFIALLPAVSILLIDYILVPMIFVSTALLAATYILVVRYYRKGLGNIIFEPQRWRHGRAGRIAMVSLIIIGIPLFFTVGIYYSWQRYALFFLLTNMLMILSGYVTAVSIFRIIRVPRISFTGMAVISFAGTALPILWFFPYLTDLAYGIPGYFGLMTLSAFAGGTMLGLAYSSLGIHERLVFNEYITVVFGLLPLVVFYLTDTLQQRIWPVFSMTGQTEFSIIGWLVMLPVMWYATHMSLSSISSPTVMLAESGESHLKSVMG